MMCMDCGVDNCMMCAGEEECSCCAEGYGVIDDECVLCTNTDANLMYCDDDETKISWCMEGWTVSEDEMTCV